MTTDAHASIRGSSLLLTGRLVSMVIVSLLQILIVRYLPPVEYGRWTYALSIVLVLQSAAALGLDRAVARFIALYYERGDHGRLLGVAALLIAAVLAVSVLIGFALLLFAADILPAVEDVGMVRLLSVLMLLVPLQALDALVAGVFSCFNRPGAIFISRYVAGPALKLAAVGLAMWWHADVLVFAAGYVLGSIAGLLLYAPPLTRLVRELDLLASLRQIRMPVREVFAFTMPLLIVDFAGALMQGAGAILLAHLTDMRQVALYAATLPVANLNQSVMRTFSLFYTSSTSRLLAKEDRAGIADLYWETTIWMAMLTFPIFVVTFAGARELTVLLFGAQYEGAGRILAILALAEYINVALGFNGLTLRVINRAWYLVTITVAAMAATVVFDLLLIPRFGAFGAAMGAASGVVVHNILKQAGLHWAIGVNIFEARYRSVYYAIGGATAAVAIADWLLPKQPWIVLPFAGLVTVALFMGCKRMLRVTDIFPEIRRVPILGALFA